MDESAPDGATVQPTHEIIFLEQGIVEDNGDDSLTQTGSIFVFQAPREYNVKQIKDSTPMYAYISVNELNIPLHPTCKSSRLETDKFSVRLPQHKFTITFHQDTRPSSLEEFEKILEWFTAYNENETEETENRTNAEKIEELGNKGVKSINDITESLQTKIDTYMDTKIEEAKEKEREELNLGGDTTRAVLRTTRSIIGTISNVAATITDKASDAMGHLIVYNPISKAIRKSSKGKDFHETLNSGAVALGKVYVTVDEKGQSIISTAGDKSSELLRERYGEQASEAAKDATVITKDAYKIFRFPAKFPVDVLLKGAAKAALADKE